MCIFLFVEFGRRDPFVRDSNGKQRYYAVREDYEEVSSDQAQIASRNLGPGSATKCK